MQKEARREIAGIGITLLILNWVPKEFYLFTAIILLIIILFWLPEKEK